MSEASGSANASAESFLDKHHFLLRRLHSLSGILPVGVFVIMHLFTNFQMMFGTFQHEVDFIHSMPALLMVEITLWLSIGFHAGLGFVYTFSGKLNTRNYNNADNWRYTFQRITGIIALLFIFFHISTLRWGWTYGSLVNTPFYLRQYFADGTSVDLATASTAYAIQHSILVLLFYIIGVYSVVYHWANGLWTAAITWGLTISVNAQRRWGYACAGLGIALSVFSAGALYASWTYKLTEKEASTIALLNEGKLAYSPYGPPEVDAPGAAVSRALGND